MQKSKSEGLGTDQQVIIKGKACTAVNKAMRLLASELKLGEGTLEHRTAHLVAKRKANSIVQFEAQLLGELQNIRNTPPSTQDQGGKAKKIPKISATWQRTRVQRV